MARGSLRHSGCSVGSGLPGTWPGLDTFHGYFHLHSLGVRLMIPISQTEN